MGNLQRLDAAPTFTRDLADQENLKWSAEFDPPPIGSDVILRINAIGLANVVGYATLDGYLGLMTVPYNPPAWWIEQNGPPGEAEPALAFGAEVALV